MKSETDKSEPRRCSVCRSTEDVQTLSIHLDGAPLRLRILNLCTQHREQFILKAGIILGRMMRRKEEKVR
jgi:hypothetical protein